ncbi:thioredoxin family protein [Beggiatoa alba]|nr:thioredoxin family protein [Beggiatoa alba]
MLNLKFRQRWAVLLLTVFWAGWVVAQTEQTPESVEVQLSTDLYQDARLARNKGVPLVVMFSQDNCHYCGIVREQFLKPMLISGDYTNKAIIREVKIDSFDDVRNFDGTLIPSDELATFLRAVLTPTVMVFDSTGKSHHRILGITNEYYYGGELDDAIDKAYSYIHRVAANN